MNRRSFLGDLALGISAAIFLPKAIAVSKWHRVPNRVLYVMNPEWFDAPYEMRFSPALFHGKWDFVMDGVPAVKLPIIHPRTKLLVERSLSEYPLRFRTPDGPVVPVFIPAPK